MKKNLILLKLNINHDPTTAHDCRVYLRSWAIFVPKRTPSPHAPGRKEVTMETTTTTTTLDIYELPTEITQAILEYYSAQEE